MKFSIRNAQKDIGYFNHMVDRFRTDTSLSSDLARVLTLAVEQGLGDLFLPSLVHTK